MATHLTNELLDEIAANPHQAVPLVDERSGKVYYLVDDEFLFRHAEHDEKGRARLAELIEEGNASGEVAEEEAHKRMRSAIERHRGRSL